jgi:hypothetical protein
VAVLIVSLVPLFFKKADIVKAVEKYDESYLSKYGRVVGLLYLFLNFALIAILYSLSVKFGYS